MLQRERRRFTPEEYLQLEVNSENRSEFYDGEIYLMSGGSLNHNQIVGNLFSVLREALRGTGCRAFQSDVRLLVERHTLFTYPDILVVCDPIRKMPGRSDTLVDARLLIEVLSPSTESYDRGEKFRLYRGLPSLQEYVLVSQDTVRVECHHREAEGDWRWREHLRLEDQLRLESLALSIPLARIYEDLPE